MTIINKWHCGVSNLPWICHIKVAARTSSHFSICHIKVAARTSSHCSICHNKVAARTSSHCSICHIKVAARTSSHFSICHIKVGSQNILTLLNLTKSLSNQTVCRPKGSTCLQQCTLLVSVHRQHLISAIYSCQVQSMHVYVMAPGKHP